MLGFDTTTRYRKDIKLMIKQGKDLTSLDSIIDKLRKREPLDPRHKDHALKGNYVNHRECHVTPDWLLVYRVDEDILVLSLTRTGSHSDLI